MRHAAWAAGCCATGCTIRCATARRSRRATTRSSRCDGKSSVHKILRRFSDVERITARIALKSARPRELSGLRDSLDAAAASLRQALPGGSALLDGSARDLATPANALQLLERAIHAEPAARVIDGGVIADGYNAELDELRALQTNAGEFLVDLEASERRQRTGIPNLRVAYNSVHGYYIEVTNSHAAEGARRLPPPPDAEERRALHHAGAEGVRGQGAVGARPRARAGEVAVRGAAFDN